MKTTIVFLKSYLSRDKFGAALDWVKSKPKRLFLADLKVWALDLETTPNDENFEIVVQEIEAAGWKIIGETFWDPELNLKANSRIVERLAGLAIEREERANKRRQNNQKRNND